MKTKHTADGREIKTREFALDVKAVEDDGTFTGYASVYDVIDSYKEIVARGAFKRTLGIWESRGKLPPILWQHRSGEPLGPYLEMREDNHGLFVKGQLLVDDVQKAREARALMKAKAIGGLSIGFSVMVDSFDKSTGITTLQDIDLWEVSVVTFPANEKAQVESIKNILDAGRMPSVREFETLLRDVGLSSAQAKSVVSRLDYARLHRDDATKLEASAILRDVFAKQTPQSILEEVFQ